MKNFLNYSFIVILGISVITHLLRIILLLINIPTLQKFKTLSNQQLSKSSLLFYYFLTIVAMLYVINLKMH
jgi:hypothetical protein